jgi:hypothetical protein
MILVELSREKKSEIVRYHIQNLDMKNLDLISHFENEFKIKISPATISRILNKFNLNHDTYDTDSNQLNIQSL